MKRNNTKRALYKFSKRNTHKRRGKEKSRAEIEKALRDINISSDNVRIKDKYDLGIGGRVSDKRRSDENSADGVFSSSKGGYGFVSIPGAERDIFIPAGRCRDALDGDYVSIVYHMFTNALGEQKTEGRVTKILSEGRKTLIGRLEFETYRIGKRLRRELVLVPDDPRFNLTPRVTESLGCGEGEKVEATIIRGNGGYVSCRVIRSFGDADSREACYSSILAEFDIETEFSDTELKEASDAASIPIAAEGRVDLRRNAIFTIDSEGAKDLDDAISLRKLPKGGFKLGVHIADVSYYVKERGALDRCAMSRGTSIYFTDKVVPMLPSVLSNGACSLNAGEDKYALSVFVTLSPRFDIVSTEIKESVIRSRVRGVYSEVNSIFDRSASRDIREKYKDVMHSLKVMHQLYFGLRMKSELRGALELGSDESAVLLDEHGEPYDVVKCVRGDAEMMIEQFMLLANEGVARLLNSKNIPCVYRVHGVPDRRKLAEFLSYAKALGLNISNVNPDAPTQHSLNAVLCEAKEKGLYESVSYLLLRSLPKATYTKEKGGHYGLAIDTYCHFTSPIRRLSDLATHRIIHKVLFGDKKSELYLGYAGRAAAAASEAELRALGAERKIESLYKCIYMKQLIGQVFDATVSSLTSFGVFVKLKNTVEGLVPIEELGGAAYYDERSMTVRTVNGVIRLSDGMRVRLAGVDTALLKISFELAD